MSINQKNRPHSQLCGTFSFRCILVLGAIFIGSIQQPAVSFAQVEDPGDAVHNGSLLTADFGTNHDQRFPRFGNTQGITYRPTRTRIHQLLLGQLTERLVPSRSEMKTTRTAIYWSTTMYMNSTTA